MARIINKTVTVSIVAFLSNFKPALVPQPQTMSEDEVEGYWLELDDTDDDELESDSSCSE